MAEQAERKAELIAALEGARGAFTRNFRAFREDVDVPAHVAHSFRRHKAVYLTGAAGMGWLLARLPGRKKKIYVDRGEEKKIKEAGAVGILLVALKFLFSIFRPAIAAFAAKKISAFAESRGQPAFPKRI